MVPRKTSISGPRRSRAGNAARASLSDIFPTGYVAAELAGIRTGQTVAVFGCGPVGQFASAGLFGANRILAVG